MSRGNRDSAAGIIKNSMRDNYSEYGVDEYYKKVGTTYRNPHYPGIRYCMFLWLNKWWRNEHEARDLEGRSRRFTIFDMACGHGEVSEAFMEWWKLGKAANNPQPQDSVTGVPPSVSPALSIHRKRLAGIYPPSIPSELQTPRIIAADPYTAEAYKNRVRLECSTLSFKEISEGGINALLSGKSTSSISSGEELESESSTEIIEMTICSFALHLIESSSELFASLWELSLKCRWLVILAPHKKPEIKPGWGWVKWDAIDWNECPMTQSTGEFLQDRVHCRIYRSVNTS
ncbi:hypothetical protein ABKN59_002680 [Abortiporus biennis]